MLTYFIYAFQEDRREIILITRESGRKENKFGRVSKKSRGKECEFSSVRGKAIGHSNETTKTAAMSRQGGLSGQRG